MFFKQNNQANDTQDVQLSSAETIFQAGVENFEDKVIKASMEKPIIAYFTAEWCGPCKQLGPIMDKAVMGAKGDVAMAKIDLDQNQELAAALRIQSVPTVFAFFQGRPVDAFQGAVPESQATAFVDKLVQLARGNKPDSIDIPEGLRQAAQALSEEDFGLAQNIYAQILQQDEKNAQAFVGLVRVYIAAGHMEEAQAMVDNAPEDIKKDPAFQEAKTALELASSKPDGSLAELEAALQKNENDHQARYDLALVQFSNGQKQAAMDNLLTIIEKDRAWNDQAARTQLLKFFEAAGQTDPLTIETRKRLSSILFS